MQEYKDGLLLFDLLQQKVWKRSEKDTLGLKQFFEKNRDDYRYKKRVDVNIARCTKEDKALLVKKYLEEDKSIEEIKTMVNENPTIHVLFSSGLVEINDKKLPKDFEPSKGVSKIYKEAANDFVIVKVNNVFESTYKQLEEAKGLVMNDFQEHIEQEWVKNLRSDHTVKINKGILKKLTKQYTE